MQQVKFSMQTVEKIILLCASFSQFGSPVPIFDCDILDLTHSINKDNPFSPGLKPFKLNDEFSGPIDGSPFVSYKSFVSFEHVGTHMDAPIHFYEKGATVEKIPLNQLVGEACVVDISDRALKDPLASLTVEDVQQWERQHGLIPNRAIILLHTGWSNRYWNSNVQKFSGYDNEKKDGSRSFPAISPEAAEWIVANRNVSAVGIDVMSVDLGNTYKYEVHNTFLSKGILAVENLDNLHKLPPRGATAFFPPLKLEGGTGGWVRAFAIGWNGPNDPCRYDKNAPFFKSIFDAALVIGPTLMLVLVLVLRR